MAQLGFTVAVGPAVTADGVDDAARVSVGATRVAGATVGVGAANVSVGAARIVGTTDGTLVGVSVGMGAHATMQVTKPIAMKERFILPPKTAVRPSTSEQFI
jgi:hypothetical protein